MDNNKSINPSPGGFHKSISIIHLALLSGQIIFALIAYAQAVKVFFGIRNMDDELIYIVPLVAVIGFVASNRIFRQRMNALQHKKSLGEKMIGYQTALLFRYALLEVPTLLAIVAFWLNSNLFYLAIAGLLLLYFLMLRPTRDQFEQDLDLSFNEKVFNDDDVIK